MEVEGRGECRVGRWEGGGAGGGNNGDEGFRNVSNWFRNRRMRL